AVMAQIVRARANNPAEAEEMNRQWQRTFKAGLNVLAFAFLVIGVVFTGMPGAGIFGLIISFVAYFVLGGRQEGRPQ
ncbi:MAG TPA: hypothetical protein VJA47_00005, partial [archaeon]|nr:hypothetical protein [archaeon]